MFNGMFNGMFTDISHKDEEIHEITKPGSYIFYFENKIGDVTFDIMCSDANVKIYGLYRGKNVQQFTLNLTQNHKNSNSTSTVLIKSILDDKSLLDIKSTISIDKKGLNTIAHFTNHNLLLSKDARTTISPQLEVIPSDVECTHATTTAPLDKKQLQYLTTRGITTTKAKQLLIDGFINEVLQIKK